MQKAWLGASCLQDIITDPLVVKDFFNIMLYDTALAGKVTKTNADDQHALEWEVDNIYMSVFVQMAGGSNVYEEIVAVLDKVCKVRYWVWHFLLIPCDRKLFPQWYH